MYQPGLACTEQQQDQHRERPATGMHMRCRPWPFDVLSFGLLLATQGVAAELGIDTPLSVDSRLVWRSVLGCQFIPLEDK
ncbi:hypothetical protein QWA_15105 [Alcaligenes faecalis subsp. faecalis NCIB 8687]|jgi:hypothetical protein|nr:hypothetical protein QWA_15105 [Alcaligenes faecalis subsp. faecalis NCIB 8687]